MTIIRRLTRYGLLAVFAALLVAGVLPPAQAGAQGRYLFDVVKAQPYRGVYAGLVAPLRKAEPWMADAGGVAAPSAKVAAGGARYELFSLCKPHDCADNMLLVMFTADGRRAFGAFRTPAELKFLGEPDAAQRQALLDGFES